MTGRPQRGQATGAVHGGRTPWPAGAPVVTPVHRETIYSSRRLRSSRR